MTMYYIIIDTETEEIGIRKINSIDIVNENYFTDVFWMLKSRLTELGSTEWKDMESKCEQFVQMFDKIGKARGSF